MIHSTQKVWYWSFWSHWWSNHQDQEVICGNRAVEAVEASEVAEAAEVNEAAEGFKVRKITTEAFRVILDLELINLMTKMILLWCFEIIVLTESWKPILNFSSQRLLRSTHVTFLKTGWWNSNFQTSGIYRHLQAKSNLHISICQNHFKRNISMWNTL
jgi:hypothetical protein